MARTILVAAMCIGLVGCQVSTAPTPVAQFDPKHAVSMMRAPWDGQYTLYRLPPDKSGQRTIVQAAHLKKNEPLGFRQREAGPVAVADDLKIPLPPGQYEWVMQPDRGQINWVGTVLLTAVVVLGTVVIVYAIAAEEAPAHIFANSHSRR